MEGKEAKDIGKGGKETDKVQKIKSNKEVNCYVCQSKLAVRYCISCTNELYCKPCFISFHEKGAKKRHVYKEIIYGAQAAGEKGKTVRFTEGVVVKNVRKLYETEKLREKL